MTKILVVDDHSDLLELVELKLSNEGYTVYTAENGDDALDIAGSRSPDLILLDIMMPNMNGWEVCRRIRETSDVPIIMVTAKGAAEDIVRGLNLGADEYITKPFSLNALAARIEALLRRMEWDRTSIHTEVDNLKKKITSTVSHELRTPLAAMMGTLDLAFQQTFEDDTVAQREFIMKAQENAQTMRWLVDDLLLIVRIDEGLELIRKEINIHESLKRIFNFLKPQIDRRELTLYIDCPANLEMAVDPLLFDHALRHLASNAMKFSPQAGKISVMANEKEEGLVLLFHNQGKPIDPAIRGQIFDRFFQGEQGDDRTYGGLGIGLSITRAIATAHGGKLSFYSATGKGTTFRLVLPGGESAWNGRVR